MVKKAIKKITLQSMGGRHWRQKKKLKRARTADLAEVGAEVQDAELPLAVGADCRAERSDFLHGEAAGRAQVARAQPPHSRWRDPSTTGQAG